MRLSLAMLSYHLKIYCDITLISFYFWKLKPFLETWGCTQLYFILVSFIMIR